MFKNFIKVALVIVALYYGLWSVGGILVILVGSVAMWPLVPLFVVLPITASWYILKKITRH